jgi:hypothetical protein
MPGFFEALNNFKSPERNTTYYVKVDGQEIVCLSMTPADDHVAVDKDQYNQLLKEGHQNFQLIDGKIVKKPKRTSKRVYPVLIASSEGLVFHDGDPYWPTEIKKGGHTWQKPAE